MVNIKDTYGNTDFYTLHLPGEGKDKLGWMMHEIPVVKVDDSITVITTATEDIFEKCPLILQLCGSKIPFINAALWQNPEKEWKKIDKLSLICRALEEVTTPYVLIMDANDAMILKDLNEAFIEKWKGFDCDILFNASEYLFPKIIADEHELDSPFCQHYLNAGVCFGLTDYAKSLYQKAYEESIAENYAPYDSEQYYIRIAWADHPRMKIDDRANLFLLSHGN